MRINQGALIIWLQQLWTLWGGRHAGCALTMHLLCSSKYFINDQNMIMNAINRLVCKMPRWHLLTNPPKILYWQRYETGTKVANHHSRGSENRKKKKSELTIRIVVSFLGWLTSCDITFSTSIFLRVSLPFFPPTSPLHALPLLSSPRLSSPLPPQLPPSALPHRTSGPNYKATNRPVFSGCQ